MFITSVYSYVPRQKVTILTIDSVRKYAPVYSKPLVLHKGVDNKLLFQFLNNEQKPINLTGNHIICRIIDNTGTKLLLTKELDLEFALTGIASLNVTSGDIDNIDSQKAFYSLEFVKTNFRYPVYLNQNAMARGEITIVDSIFPSFVPSTILTTSEVIDPSLAPADIISGLYNSDSLVTTFQISLDDFIGTVIVEGASALSSTWYEVENLTITTATTGTIGLTIKGYHPFFRVKFDKEQGTVTDILVR